MLGLIGLVLAGIGIYKSLEGSVTDAKARWNETEFGIKVAEFDAKAYGDQATLATRGAAQSRLEATFAGTQAKFAGRDAKAQAVTYRGQALGVAEQGAEIRGKIAARAGASGLGGGSVGRQQQKVRRQARGKIGGLKAEARLTERRGELESEGFLLQKAALELRADAQDVQAINLAAQQQLSLDQVTFLESQRLLGLQAIKSNLISDIAMAGLNVLPSFSRPDPGKLSRDTTLDLPEWDATKDPTSGWYDTDSQAETVSPPPTGGIWLRR